MTSLVDGIAVAVGRGAGGVRMLLGRAVAGGGVEVDGSLVGVRWWAGPVVPGGPVLLLMAAGGATAALPLTEGGR